MVPGRVYQNDRVALAHLECCSLEDLKELLKARALRETDFFQDAYELSTNPSLEKIGEFERMYGDYHELAESATEDELSVAAVVGELKDRLGKS